MSLIVIVALVVKVFITGTIVGVWIERRHRRRLELARVMFRPRRSCANYGAE